MIPLIYSEVNEEKTVTKISGNQETKKHLEDLGFHTGAKVSVISKIGGNLIVKIKETRIAIDKKMAMKIYVN
jgi:ferrous iron transport protein A